MAHYFVGDIQGCYSELMSLLDRVNFEPSTDTLVPVGDLVARGPESELVASLMLKLGDAVKPVLGNHDLHLLSIYSGLYSAKKNDKLEALLNAEFIEDYIDWLRFQPLIRCFPEFNLVTSHAGLHPDLSLDLHLSLADSAQQKLRADNYQDWLKKMYGNKPDCYSQDLSDTDKFRLIVNITTRMRYLDKRNRLDFKAKMPVGESPKSLTPWFECYAENTMMPKVIFGHWASLLGQTNRQSVIALDTGCVWGNELTMYCAENQTYYRKSALA
ncbi:symmetrical bis(5'-nucleosyl)-tetraphosphatase [Catenovulum maritimum]|uniref:bis(5'-nucleosyl)-tetraphosphatase (symmetrical) n=1 Tax=Catenovulum maritimum TaxID=1513271 RepID=A0A0J8JNS2_9ALTE|nr:symmetrical bis(5'-nucleosyl)-tetraphosphatase [Catenovulum maritimum]KMT66276.1 hypothetical protein XM47_04600 [Catenovulum maritimum]